MKTLYNTLAEKCRVHLLDVNYRSCFRSRNIPLDRKRESLPAIPAFPPLYPLAIFHSTCKFSQLLLLLSFKHILLRISLARFRLRTVLLLCSFDNSLPLLPWRRSFFSRDSLRRICFRTPTRSSSTLCLSPLDVSMNLHSRDVANCFPSLTNCSFKLIKFG